MRRCCGSYRRPPPSVTVFDDECPGGWWHCHHVGAFHVHQCRGPDANGVVLFRVTKLARAQPGAARWDLINREPTFTTLDAALAYAAAVAALEDP